MSDPLPLGRSVVVGRGQPAPAPWRECERIHVEKIDAGAADVLGQAWRARKPLVVELTPGIGLDRPHNPPAESITDLEPWEWEVDLDLVGERLHHALWANSVDAREGALGYQWAEQALVLGARLDTSGHGDVLLPNGRPAICDGGPLDASLPTRLGVATVHRIGLEHGSLTPLGDAEPGGLTLAPDQLAAVGESRAAARVIAPAGSGKTRVLTERARLLQTGWGIPPSAMALVAYNVRAAREMQSRLHDLGSTRVRTLNALGRKLCGRSTIEEPDVRRILGDLVVFPRRTETDPAAPWIEALSRVRLGLASPADVEAEVGDVSDLDGVARRYRQELRRRHAADFDEQVTAAIERLLADPTFRQHSQRFARVLLVDEFQDLTPAHMLLIRLLSGPAGAVFGVGDDDQTIYGYAGASPRWLVDFEHWFPGSTDHSLEVNYRCPAPVVKAATTLLMRNSLRVDKTIRAAKAEKSGSLAVRPGGGRPASTTVARVLELLGSGAEAAEIAVLSRVNASLVPVQVLLRHSGVPVNRATDSRFLQRGGVRAAIAWLSIATAPAETLPGSSLREAARRPRRGMSHALLDLVSKRRSEDGLTRLADWLDTKGSIREAEKVSHFATDVASLRRAAGRVGTTTAALLAVVRSRIGDGGLDASADSLDQWSHGAIAAHADDLAALSELAEFEPDPTQFGQWLHEHLSSPGDDPGVTLASIHAVKGREWPHVVVHHATGGLVPHRLAWDMEEERRVFHVGLTRCVESLTVVTGEPVSPFVAEMEGVAAPERETAGGVRPERSGAGRVAGPRAGASRSVRGPSPSARARRQDAAEGTLQATVGLRFVLHGHEYEVLSVDDSGVVAVVSGERASTKVRFGTLIKCLDITVVLGHPACHEAAERLRRWRTERARSSGKPAYTVFDDKTLWALAAALPTDESGLAAIPGIGPVKLETYGPDLTAMFEEMRSQQPIVAEQA